MCIVYIYTYVESKKIRFYMLLFLYVYYDFSKIQPNK